MLTTVNIAKSKDSARINQLCLPFFLTIIEIHMTKLYYLFGRVTWPTLAVVVIIGFCALFFGFQYSLKKHAPTEALKDLASATILPQPRAIIPFSLTDNQGHLFSNANLKGHWSLVFFGFTHCGYICPTTMAELNKVYQILQQEKIQEPQYVMITIDPERDNAQQMNTFVTTFNKKFIGATGTQAQIDNLTKSLNVVVMKVQAQAGTANKSTIDHSGTIMLLNPNGDVVAIFTMPHVAQKIASDYKKIAHYYG
jgi:protein SCO1/2